MTRWMYTSTWSELLFSLSVCYHLGWKTSFKTGSSALSPNIGDHVHLCLCNAHFNSTLVMQVLGFTPVFEMHLPHVLVFQAGASFTILPLFPLVVPIADLIDSSLRCLCHLAHCP